MTASTRCGTWVEHFPGNLRWSNAMQIVKGMAPYGAVALEEIDRVAWKLKARESEEDLDKAWFEEWYALAEYISGRGAEAAEKGRSITAGNYYMRAGNYYYSAERFMAPSDEKIRVYRKALHGYREGLARLHPNVEFIDVPYEGTSLPAYFMKATGVSGPAPTVVLFDGMDNCKDMSVIFAGIDFAKRGINTLAIDGPGQSEALRLRNIASRPDYEVAGTAAYEYVASRPDVDASRVAVMGYSFGGYHAPRVCGFEKRYAACVALGAMHWDMHAWQSDIKARNAANPKTSFSSDFQFRWVIGAPDNETALEWSKRFTLEGVAQNVQCPTLILHGDNDRIVPLREAKILYEKIGAAKKELKIFTEEEGGREHCQVDHRQIGIDYVGDWLLENM